jgi:hypothetical protein
MTYCLQYPFPSISGILSIPVLLQPLELDTWVDNCDSGQENVTTGDFTVIIKTYVHIRIASVKLSTDLEPRR